MQNYKFIFVSKQVHILFVYFGGNKWRKKYELDKVIQLLILPTYYDMKISITSSNHISLYRIYSANGQFHRNVISQRFDKYIRILYLCFALCSFILVYTISFLSVKWSNWAVFFFVIEVQCIDSKLIYYSGKY